MSVNLTPTADYVVFVRTTTQLWNAMTAADRADNTLYFVTNGDTGSLYLGNTLIAGNISTATDIDLNTLTDVNLQGVLDGDILIFDSEYQTWTNTTVSEAISSAVTEMTGARAPDPTTNYPGRDGLSGLVPQPLIADAANYLRGDGSWVDPVAGVNATLTRLIGTNPQYDDSNKSIREIANEAATLTLTTVIEQADPAFDTLGEITEYLANHPEIDTILNLATTVNGVSTVDEETEQTIVTTPGLVHFINGYTTYDANNQAVSVKGLQENVQTLLNNTNTMNRNLGATMDMVENLRVDMYEGTGKIAALSNALKWHQVTIS